MRYSSENDLILDQFVGGGTTLVEAKLFGRNAIGVDINPNALKRCREKCDFEWTKCKSDIRIVQGDACDLAFIGAETIDFICAHPPYGNIIQYSEDIDGDLSRFKISDFYLQMRKVAEESFRVLKAGKFCAILMGDARNKGCVIPMSFEVMKIFEAAGFKTKEIIIKEQHNCRATGFWKTNSVKYNFLLLTHEYLFVFRKSA